MRFAILQLPSSRKCNRIGYTHNVFFFLVSSVLFCLWFSLIHDSTFFPHNIQCTRKTYENNQYFFAFIGYKLTEGLSCYWSHTDSCGLLATQWLIDHITHTQKQLMDHFRHVAQWISSLTIALDRNKNENKYKFSKNYSVDKWFVCWS